MRAHAPNPRAQLVVSQHEPIAPSLRFVLASLLKLTSEEAYGRSLDPRPDSASALERGWSNRPPHSDTTVTILTAEERITAELLLDVQVGDERYVVLCVARTSSDEHTLSPREREIVRLVARGLPNKSIAETLDISPWTVNTYLRRIFAKLGVTSRAEMVASSIAAGLLQSGTPTA